MPQEDALLACNMCSFILLQQVLYNFIKLYHEYNR